MQEKREFRGVWIPAGVWLDNRLTATEKIVLIEIDSLDGEDGCYASNSYLAKFCQCGESTVSRAVTKLRNLGYITVDSFDGRKRVMHSCLADSARQPCHFSKAESSNPQDILLGDVTSESKDISSRDSDERVRAIIDYLNEKVGTRYSYRNKAYNSLINARLSEGFTVEDFKAVIDTKVAEWAGTEWAKYLRPKTLFSPSHFEAYLNQAPQPTSYLDSIDWSKYQMEEIDPTTIH